MTNSTEANIFTGLSLHVPALFKLLLSSSTTSIRVNTVIIAILQMRPPRLRGASVQLSLAPHPQPLTFTRVLGRWTYRVPAFLELGV